MSSKRPKSPRRKKSVRENSGVHSGRSSHKHDSPVSNTSSSSKRRGSSQRFSDEHKIKRKTGSKSERVGSLRNSGGSKQVGECELCHDQFDAGAKRDSAAINKLGCGHKFHNGCIARWMFANESECPMCGYTYDVECDSDDDAPPRLETPHGLRQSVRAAERAQLQFEEACMRGEDPTAYHQKMEDSNKDDARMSGEKDIKQAAARDKNGPCVIQ